MCRISLLSSCLTVALAVNMLLLAISAHASTAHEVVVDRGAYSRTITQWKNALETTDTPSGSRTWIGALDGNGVGDKKHRGGNRNTIVYMPSQTKMHEKVDIIFFFHGLRGFGVRDFQTRILSRAKQLSTLGHNFLVVAPEMPWSQNTVTPNKRQTHVWRGSDRENIVTFYQSVRRVIGSHFLFHIYPRTMCVQGGICDIRVGKIIMVGHSAGGSAIRMAARSGGLNSIRPNRLVYSDAGYGTWTDQTWNHYVRDNPDTHWVILVRKWDTPHRNTVRFFKRFRRVPENILYRVFSRKTHRHGTIGDECLLWSYPEGK